MATTTITFGDCAENHVGMQKLGALAPCGFTAAELAAARDRFEAAGCDCELVDLVAAGCVEEHRPEPASVLVVRGGVDALLAASGGTAAELLAEQEALEPDTKALMRGRVVNKVARHNLCFADVAQEPDYERGRGRVVAFGDLPLTAAARAALAEFFGAKAAQAVAEANYYYDAARCGIGFHGDSERRLVVALRLGATMPLHYQWFLRGAPVGARIALSLDHGTLYAMSAKAVGTDWKRRVVPTLRHAAGCAKYLAVKAVGAPR
jgi:hypothetical protein